MDPKSLLEQFLGPDAGQKAGGAVQTAKGKLANSGLAGVAGGVAAGGLLGVLLGNKKARKKVGKLAGGVVGYGGA
ncbi:MAG: tellurite resistance TerB family protein, partial [Alphaproteobacteria bacterium]|nr:tellurite resistance TerB family protein [Alphaproteobacteria bacterium]